MRVHHVKCKAVWDDYSQSDDLFCEGELCTPRMDNESHYGKTIKTNGLLKTIDIVANIRNAIKVADELNVRESHNRHTHTGFTNTPSRDLYAQFGLIMSNVESNGS